MSNTTGHEGVTKETAPFYVWASHVADKARCSMEVIEANRARLLRWYEAGEPVWMAADGVKQLVHGATVAAKDDADGLRMIIRESVVNGVPGIAFYGKGR